MLLAIAACVSPLVAVESPLVLAPGDVAPAFYISGPGVLIGAFCDSPDLSVIEVPGLGTLPPAALLEGAEAELFVRVDPYAEPGDGFCTLTHPEGADVVSITIIPP